MNETVLSHIYINKNWVKEEIQLMCNLEWVPAKIVDPNKSYCSGWSVNNVRQWSLGAGHNATCVRCLEIWARKTNIKLGQVIVKLSQRIRYLEGHIQENGIEGVKTD